VKDIQKLPRPIWLYVLVTSVLIAISQKTDEGRGFGHSWKDLVEEFVCFFIVVALFGEVNRARHLRNLKNADKYRD
jgi:hypothetical protein